MRCMLLYVVIYTIQQKNTTTTVSASVAWTARCPRSAQSAARCRRGSARKARDRRGAGRDRPGSGLVERRQPAKTGKSGQFAARWRTGVGGRRRKNAELRLSRTATRSRAYRPRAGQWSPAGEEGRTEWPTRRFFEVGEGSGWPEVGKRSHGRHARPQSPFQRKVPVAEGFALPFLVNFEGLCTPNGSARRACAPG